MELDALYTKAKSLIDTVKKEKPEAVSYADSALCIIVSDEEELFTGITGISIDKNSVTTTCSEYNAIMSMLVENKINAKQMISVSFADKSILKPCSNCIKLLYRVNSANTACQVVISEKQSVTAESLETSGSSENIFDQIPDFNFASDSPANAEHKPLGMPAEFAADAEADEDNPFYEPPINRENKEDVPDYLISPQAAGPNFLYSDLDDARKMGMSGYPHVQQSAQGQQVNPQNGYAFPQDGNGYFTPYQHGVPQPQQMQGINPQQMQQYNPQYMQGMNPQQMQQGINPQQMMQQGMNPQQMMQQGMNPQQMQQGINPQQMMQQGINPQQMQGGYGMPQQQNGYMNAAPYNQNPGNRSVNVSYQNNGSGYNGSHYQQSIPQSQLNSTNGSAAAYRQKVNAFMGKTAAPVQGVDHQISSSSGASMEELMKQAKEKKKVAKVNSDFKKKMKDMGF